MTSSKSCKECYVKTRKCFPGCGLSYVVDCIFNCQNHLALGNKQLHKKMLCSQLLAQSMKGATSLGKTPEHEGIKGSDKSEITNNKFFV